MRRHLVLVLAGLVLGAWSAAQAPAPTAAAPAGWRQVSYGPVSFAVPAGWPVHDLAAEPGRCARLDVHAVYLGRQGQRAACPARALGKTEALQVEPLDRAGQQVVALATHATVVGGQPARTGPSSPAARELVVALDGAGVELTASYGGDPALARRILASVRVHAPGGTATPAGGTATPAGGTAPLGATATPARWSGQARPQAVTVTPGVYTGKGFDTCAAPSAGTMRAWLASPYRAIGVYIGGAMRTCGDGNLSASWISTVSAMGWHLVPTYVGLQAPCVWQPGLAHIDPARAATQGVQAAADAAARASGVFRLGARTPVYFDMEAYDRSQPGCARAVLSFLSAWTGELHRRGYRSGVYSGAASAVTDLVRAYSSPSVHRPDAIWSAHWTGRPSIIDPYLPAWAWPSHQRIAQYRGAHDERWGNVTVNVDNDYVDSVLAGRPLAATPPPA